MLKFLYMFRKLIFILLCLAVVLAQTNPISAQSESVIKETQDAKKKGTNLQDWLGQSMTINLVSTLNVVAGDIPDEVLDGRTFLWIPGGALATTNGLVASLLNAPPVSGIQYLADLWNTKLLSKPAYAQGIGFKGLQPILPVWRNFRNMIYLFSSIIFVVIGIMIILRVKISPQAVVTVQNAIPQLITTLILVTFSYAIAGLLIDLSQFLQAFGIAVIFPNLLSGGSAFSNKILSLLSNTPVLRSLTLNYASLSNPNLLTLGQLLVLPGILTAASVVIFSLITGVALSILSFNPLGLALGAAGGVLISLILAIAILIWTIKFLIGLFKCYATVLFKIILAPLEIGIGAFPGSKIGFSSWIIGLIANLSVFPLSLLFLVLSNYLIVTIITSGLNLTLTDILKGNFFASGLWTPSLLGGDLTSFGLRSFGGIAAMAIALSTLLILSKLPELIPQVIFALKPSLWAGSMKDIPLLGSMGTVAKGTAASYTAREIYDERGLPAKTKIGADVRDLLQRKIGKEGASALSEGVRSVGRSH